MVESPQMMSMMVIFQSEANRETILRSTVAKGNNHQKRAIQLLKDDFDISV